MLLDFGVFNIIDLLFTKNSQKFTLTMAINYK